VLEQKSSLKQEIPVFERIIFYADIIGNDSGWQRQRLLDELETLSIRIKLALSMLSASGKTTEKDIISIYIEQYIHIILTNN